MRLAQIVELSALCLALACSKENAVDASQTTNVCSEGTLDCAPCAPGEGKCQEATLLVCQSDGQGFDAISVCVSPALCVKGLQSKACADPVCNAADTKCDGATMVVCSEGRDVIEVTSCVSADACVAGLTAGKCAAGQCSIASDCSGQDTECRKRTCAGGTCGFQAIPDGTAIQAQTVGDCRQVVCDGAGTTRIQPQPSDIPNDGEECTVESCDGTSPKTDWVAEGTACSGGGTCDGAGQCKGCLAGKTRCANNALQTCDANGQWGVGQECLNSACIQGACVGVCSPGSKQCTGLVPQSCDSNGVWNNGTACVNSACVNGECAGGCVPGETACSGNSVLTCTASGQWPSTAAPCTASACVAGGCVGVCEPGSKKCSGTMPQLCDAGGAWHDASPCDALSVCSMGSCVSIPSCANLATNCGSAANQSCCAAALVPGGSFMMGRGQTGTDAWAGQPDEVPEHQATLSAFRLDLYETTVGRFRKFVEGYPANKPATGMGANPHAAGTGWSDGWNSELPADQAALKLALKCQATYQTWKDAPGTTENLPINCVDWYLAFAFCAWDGGWLPTEAEWERAAAGGDENRLYPWGQVPPASNLAAYSCTADGSAASSCGFSDILAVGTRPAGAGRWGHQDLAGNMFEWVFDAYAANWYGLGAGNPCTDCANAGASSYRVARGGRFDAAAQFLRAAYRLYQSPNDDDHYFGIRCARPVQ